MAIQTKESINVNVYRSKPATGYVPFITNTTVTEKQIRAMLKDPSVKVVNAETGKIVNQYNVNDNFAVGGDTPTTKFFATITTGTDGSKTITIDPSIDYVPSFRNMYNSDPAKNKLADGDTRKFTKFGTGAFAGSGLTGIPSFIDWDNVEDIPSDCFFRCGFSTLTLPSKLKSIGSYCFMRCRSLTRVTFKGTPESIGGLGFSGTESGIVINCPWSEGEVAGAPWGATNATINYDYVETDTASKNGAPAYKSNPVYYYYEGTKIPAEIKESGMKVVAVPVPDELKEEIQKQIEAENAAIEEPVATTEEETPVKEPEKEPEVAEVLPEETTTKEDDINE